MAKTAAIALLCAAFSLAACRDRSGDKSKRSRPEPAAKTTAVKDLAREVKIPWISDDWAAAEKRARDEKKPIFVDLWAPWCHTCLSMKQIVMVDPSLGAYLDRFVWLEVDTDREVNAGVVEKLPIAAWPTFYVVSPAEGAPAVRARQVGSMSIGQLRELLDQGEQAHQAGLAAAGALDASTPLGMLQAGDATAAAGDPAKADEWYGKALAASPPTWSRAPDVLVKQINARKDKGDLAGCAELAMREAERTALGMTAMVADFAATASECAAVLDVPRARLLRARLGEAIREVLDSPESTMSVDDQSDALRVLREMAIALEDPKTARSYAVRQRELLDRAVAAAATPYARMTYTWPRAEVYVYLEEAAKLVPELEKLVTDLPKEYDPPHRLAYVLMKSGKYAEARAALAKASALAYGPRKGSMLRLAADIEQAAGDVAAEKAARQAVIDFYTSQPPGKRRDKALADAQAALAAVGKKKSP
ncbi:MAG TPA: thioredoxin family protein [Kofleriaceae bacterium]|nr:thioredoxin family protein [Kofleriaceae bacterium]